jgi:hypothetical protein
MIKRIILASAAFAALMGLAALSNAAQFVVPTTGAVGVQHLNQGDLVPYAAGGVGSVPTPFADAGLVGGTLHEQDAVPLTGFSITPNNNTTLLFLNPAGTLATGTITFPATPGSAQAFCWLSSQTQTAVTMTANTGQSVVGTAVTAGVAGTSYCWRYIALTATWYRYL